MTNALQVKEVNFNGAVLKAVQDTQKIIWVGVSWVCNGIGMSKNLKDTQVKKLQSDMLLNRGCVKFDAGVFDQNNETLALQLDYLPLWLAKIHITPAMKRDSPELVDKLVEYQLKAKDVLAQAFLPQYQNQQDDISQLQNMIEYLISIEKQRVIQEDRRIDQEGKFVDAFCLVAQAYQDLSKDISSIKYSTKRMAPEPLYTDWKAYINSKVDILAKHYNIKYTKILSKIYKKLTSEYGYNLNQIKADLLAQGVKVYTMLDVVEIDESIKSDFEFLLCNEIEELEAEHSSETEAFHQEPIHQETNSVTPASDNPIKAAITPLALAYGDTSTGYSNTYRKVYAKMNVDWSRRKNRYRNVHKLKNQPSKYKLLQTDAKLFKLFTKTIKDMLCEVGANGD